MLVTSIDAGAASAELRRIASRLKNPSPFVKTWAQTVVRRSQAIARAKGGRSFWNDFARNIHLGEVRPDSASLINDHVAAAQKQYGGVIRAKDKKALTIPVAPEAKGKRASEFAGGGRQLFVLKTKSKNPDDRGLLGYSTNGEFHPLFALRLKTKPQRPQPWLPPDGEITSLGINEAWFWLEKELKRP